MIELLLTFALAGVVTGIVWFSLSGLQPGNALKDSQVIVSDTLRRAQLQATRGHFGDLWGVHFSDSDGCSLPAVKIHVFRGTSFVSATETTATISLPAGGSVSALSIGGGCDVKFSRYDGSTTSTGTITVANVNGETRTISINAYGRVTSP